MESGNRNVREEPADFLKYAFQIIKIFIAEFVFVKCLTQIILPFVNSGFCSDPIFWAQLYGQAGVFQSVLADWSIYRIFVNSIIRKRVERIEYVTIQAFI